MQRSLRIVLSALLLLPFEAFAAEDISGTYVGAYTNKAGKSGDYQLTLRRARAAAGPEKPSPYSMGSRRNPP